MRSRAHPPFRPLRGPSLRAVACALAAGAAGLALAGPAYAGAPLDGRWRQSALREDFTVQQWLDTGCGPAPRSTSTGGGEVVEIRTEGDELAIIGGGRVFRTNGCYDPMPTLGRQSHSRDPSRQSWRTQCTTSPADPRRATLNTLVVATTEAHIDLVETGRYEITLESGRCIADVKRTRSFTLVGDDVPATPTTTATASAVPEKPTAPQASCAAPGEPQRLEVRPSKKLIRTGEGFTFRGTVLDARGCTTRTATSWHVAPGSEDKGVSVDGSGHVTVAPDATEGTFELVATAAGKDARVVVEVVAPARYDELLARSGLNAAGENDEAATVTIASQSIGAGEGRVEDRSRERRLLFVAIIGAVLLALGVAAVFVLRRARKATALARDAERRHEARLQEALDRRRRREAEHVAQLREHEESLRAAQVASEALATESAGAPQRSPGKARGKICPTCGERFEGGAEFCGKDGTVLVLIN